MAWFLRSRRQSLRAGFSRCVLGICWAAGLYCGSFLALHGQNSLVTLMRRLPATPVSIVSMLSSCMVFFLFTAYAVSFSKLWLLYPLCFGKGLLYAFVCGGIQTAFGSAGWLIRSFLIGDSVSMLCLLGLWMKLISGEKEHRYGCAAVCFGISALACWADSTIISPFLAGLIEI